jgi:hypothetical protein
LRKVSFANFELFLAFLAHFGSFWFIFDLFWPFSDDFRAKTLAQGALFVVP